MGGLVSLLPYVGVDELQGKVVEVAKCLTAEFLGTMFLVLVNMLLLTFCLFKNSVYLYSLRSQGDKFE